MRDPDDRLFFSTYTNLNWLPVLQSEQYKNIVLNSLEFLVINKRVTLYAFVVMPNHIHLIWLIENGFQGKEGQKVPAMSDNWVNEISARYIELFEKVTGRKF